MIQYNLADCDYLTELCSGLKYMGNEYPKEWFTSTVPIEFEGMTLPAPVGYKKYLTAVFGDYMTPPDDSERTTDHGILFVDTERSYLDTLYGDEWKQYNENKKNPPRRWIFLLLFYLPYQVV